MMTPTILTQEIHKVLDYADARRCCVLIQGRTGRGKTEAVRAWCAGKPHAYYIDCPPEGGMPAIHAAISRATKANPSEFQDFLAANKAILILDECARLIQLGGSRPKALEWLRRLHDSSGVALAFVATDFFVRECTGGKVGEYLEQFVGRFRDQLTIPDFVSRAECRDILAGTMPTPADDAIRWAFRIANEKGKGGARRLWWVLEDAKFVAQRMNCEIDVALLRTVLKDYEGRKRLPTEGDEEDAK